MMDDKDFDVHVVNEHRYRTQQENEVASKKVGVAPPFVNKAVDVIGQGVSALGSGAYDILNPIHKDEEGQIDWGKTAVHGAVEAPIALYLAGKAAGLVKSGYNSTVGVDPTIAAQNEVSREKILLEREKMGIKNKPVLSLQSAIFQEPEATIQATSKGSRKTLDPIEQKLLNLYEQQQAAKSNQTQQSPVAATVSPTQINSINAQQNVHPLDSYVKTQAAKDGFGHMNANDLSRLSGMPLHDNSDVQTAIAKLRTERNQSNQFKAAFAEPAFRSKPLSPEQIESRRQIIASPMLPSAGGGGISGGARLSSGVGGLTQGAGGDISKLNPMKLMQ